jgi:hypothetical protein
MTAEATTQPATPPSRLPAADILGIGQFRDFVSGIQGDTNKLSSELEDAQAVIATIGKMNDPVVTGPLQTAIEAAHVFFDALAAVQRGINSHSQGEEYVAGKGNEAAAATEFLAPQ